jgi:protein-disulfide isomerase
MESLKSAARDVGGVPDFDAKYSTMLPQIKEDIELGRQLDIGGTPTFYVNGVLVERVSPQILDAIIAHALKAAPQNPS